jgi:peptidoglycan/LPS O-acetylase OafA/YrhL
MISLRARKFSEAGENDVKAATSSEAAALVGERDVTSGSVHLDALRGLAALLVFSGHTRALYFTSAVSDRPVVTRAEAGKPTENTKSQAATVVEGSGADFGEIRLASEAVILFFVLSGYLVGGSVLRLMRTARWSWRVYLTKRITRLYVVLIPALILGAALDKIGSKFFGPGSVYATPAGIQIVTTYGLAERLRPSVFIGDLFFLDPFRVPVLGTNVALWSLSNEFWYYLIFPMLCLALVWGRKVLWRTLWLIAAVALMIFTGRDMSLLFPLWILGALVSVIPRKFTAARAKWMSMLVGVVLLAVMLGVRLLRWPALQADYLIALATAVLLYFLAQQTDQAKPGVYKTLSTFFSRISYTLYLFHVPLAVFLCALLNNPWHQWPKSPIRLVAFVISDAILVTFAYLLWKLFESRTEEIRRALFRVEEQTFKKVL